MQWFGSSALETKIFAVWSKTDVLVSINSTVFLFPQEVIFGSPPVFPGIMESCLQTLAWWFCPWHLKHLVVLWQSGAMCDFLRQIKHLPCLRSKDFLAFTSVITLQRTEGCDLWQKVQFIFRLNDAKAAAVGFLSASSPFHFGNDECTWLVRLDVPTLEDAHLSRASSSVLKALNSSS